MLSRRGSKDARDLRLVAHDKPVFVIGKVAAQEVNESHGAGMKITIKVRKLTLVLDRHILERVDRRESRSRHPSR